MRVLFSIYGPGWGHRSRSQALMRELRRRGHEVGEASYELPAGRWDWLLLDWRFLPQPKLLERWRRQVRRVGLLNGRGRRSEAGYDLVIIQGLGARLPDGVAGLAGPEAIILRESLRNLSRRPDGSWLVYGGGNDPWHLGQRLGRIWRWGHRTLHLLQPAGKPRFPPQGRPRLFHHRKRLSEWEMAEIIGRTSLGIVVFGQIAWELISNGVPAVVFWRKEDQTFVEPLAERHWAVVADAPGPPNAETFRQLIARGLSFRPRPPFPDGLGATRIVDLMERIEA